MNSYFLTGATGTLGTEVVSELLSASDGTIYVLVRAISDVEAENRLRALWWELPRLLSAIGDRIVPVKGDITLRGLGLDDGISANLRREVSYVIHCAAETGIQKSKETLRRINVEGTRHVADFAASLDALERFVHVSTAYVAGRNGGRIFPDAPFPAAFNSQYEWSKAESEKVVRSSGLPFTIVRPGMIVGNSQTGRTRYFNTVYYALKLMLQGKLRCLPAARSQLVGIAPADCVARELVTLATRPEAEGGTFHLTPPADCCPRLDELVDFVRNWAGNHLQLSLPAPLYVKLPFFSSIGRWYNSRKEAKRRSIISNLAALSPYFQDDHVFDRAATDSLAGKYDAQWHRFLPAVLEFACRHNFMYLTDKSVFQQALVRRESRHYPVTYYDITSDGLKEVSGKEMNSLIAGYCTKLKELGVGPGDTVAVSGINCSEHAAIDSAIGLVGATSVPIYYTAPKEEVALLLRKSGARWFFVGDRRMEQNLDGLDVQVVRFGPLGSGSPAGPDSSLNHPVPDPDILRIGNRLSANSFRRSRAVCRRPGAGCPAGPSVADAFRQQAGEIYPVSLHGLAELLLQQVLAQADA